MTTINLAYGSATSITCTVASLASAAARQSTKIDNTTNLFLDASLELAFKMAAGSTSGQSAINVYVAGSNDGTIFDYPATGTDGSITLTTNNVRLVSVINVASPTGAGTFSAVVPSVATYFGGVLPPFWAIVIENQTGVAFDSTEGNHTKSYRGITATNA